MNDDSCFRNPKEERLEKEAFSSADAVHPSADEDQLFQILDRFMNLPLEELPTEEEITAQYPEMAREIWRCLEGMKLIRKEESVRLASGTDFQDSSVSASTSRGGTRPEVMLEMEPVGDFELVREIARGGMGVVYEAWQNSLHRLVALKILPLASTFDQRQLQRFRNEAAAAAQLDHPGIVPIYAIGCERGIHFYAMKLINGPHLGTIIHALRKERGESADCETETTLLLAASQTQYLGADSSKKSSAPTSASVGAEEFSDQETTVSSRVTLLYSDQRAEYFRSAARQMKQAADALEYAHQCGVVHRDVKPANLMLDVDGKLWITDFGLAQVRSDVQLTQTGEIFGTPRYMSPEQAQGNHRLADHRVDIYSLGATFYEVFTLHPIFSETNHVQLLKQIVHEDPKRPSFWDPAIPRDLETILLKCLAKQPGERYESAGELAEDLERFLENRPIKARRLGFWERVAKWRCRHPRFLAFSLLFFAVVWVGTLFSHHLLLKEKRKTQFALAEAQARFEKARNAADQLIKIAEENLKSEHSLEIRQAKQKILDTALVLYQDFLKIDELDPETEKQLTASRNYVQQFMELLSESQGPPIFLLLNPSVQKELALSDEQKEKLATFSRDFRKKGERLFRDSRNFTPEERVNRLLEQLRMTEAFLKETLSEKQTARLRQIQLQTQSERILDDAVRQELNLTDEQTEALRACFLQPQHVRSLPDFGKFSGKGKGNGNFVRQNERREEINFQMEPSPEMRPPETRSHETRPSEPRRPEPPLEKKRNGDGSYGAKSRFIESILTPEQLQKWNEMKGEEFLFEEPRGNRSFQGRRSPENRFDESKITPGTPEPFF